MEIYQIKPYTSISDYFVHFFLLLVDINVVLIYRQHRDTPSSWRSPTTRT